MVITVGDREKEMEIGSGSGKNGREGREHEYEKANSVGADCSGSHDIG